jgi:ribosomal protein L11 methyltransferase
MGRVFEPFAVGSRLCIVPPSSRVELEKRVAILMAPGAFGSGEHETTRSCLEIIESLPVAGARILDLGSGTGILAISALRLGAARATCVDTSHRAVETCRHNCQLNRVGDRVEHLCGTLGHLSGGGFDLVFANIYGDILLELARDLVARARFSATLLLSGILWQEAYAVSQTYAQMGCERRQFRTLDEYCTMLFVTPPPGRGGY